jgi:hypothetical protein
MATIETSLPAAPVVFRVGLVGNQANLQAGFHVLLSAALAGVIAVHAVVRIVGRRCARRIRRYFPRQLSSDERDDRASVILHIQQRLTYVRHQREMERRSWQTSQKESRMLAKLMGQKLGQLGLDYIFSLDGQKVRRFPKFAAVEISPDQYRFKVDSIRLPRGVNEMDITKPEIIAGLECTTGKTIQYHLDEGGLWLMVDRQSGLRNIPRFVDYANMINTLTSNDGPLAIPLGLGANRMRIKIDFQHETTAHFLIGGTTGAGKTNTVHAIICTLIQQDPFEVKLVLVDLKQIEFMQYDGVPHLERPIVTDPAQVLSLFKDIWTEVQRRMEILRKSRGVNHVREYNRLHRPGERLPYIVVIVDELAIIMLDRTLKHKEEIESYLARIASVGRASGVHLVLATQRPDKNVLTPLITANFPGRIGLACATVFDSMTIIGNGDACFHDAVPPGRAILSHGRHRTQFQIALIRDSIRREKIDDALGGRVGARKMLHDVTIDEMARYAIAYLRGIFNQHSLYAQFNDRGISRPEIVETRDRYVCRELGLCPGHDQCGQRTFPIDDQAYCIRQTGRGLIQPYYVVNCADFFTSSSAARENVLQPQDDTGYKVHDTVQSQNGDGAICTPIACPTPVIIDQSLGTQPAKRSIDERNAQRAAIRKESEQAALEFLLSNPYATAGDLATHMKVSRRTAWKYITSLTMQDKLNKNGNGWHSVPRTREGEPEHKQNTNEDPDAEFKEFSKRVASLVERNDVKEKEIEEQPV